MHNKWKIWNLIAHIVGFISIFCTILFGYLDFWYSYFVMMFSWLIYAIVRVHANILEENVEYDCDGWF